MSSTTGSPRPTAPPADDLRASIDTSVGGAVGPPASFTCLPASADRGFMELVDAGLDEVTAELTTIWHIELAPHWPADVLDDQDLPELLRPLAAGGKRIRPRICFWGWVAAGGREAATQDPSSLSDVVRVSVRWSCCTSSP